MILGMERNLWLIGVGGLNAYRTYAEEIGGSCRQGRELFGEDKNLDI